MPSVVQNIRVVCWIPYITLVASCFLNKLIPYDFSRSMLYSIELGSDILSKTGRGFDVF